jgi:hypothetical protein
MITASLKVGSVMAVGSAVLQGAAGATSSSSNMLVPVISAAIGGVMSYAVLKTTVQKMERDVRDMRRDMGEMYTLLRDAMTKIAHIEGRLDRRS